MDFLLQHKVYSYNFQYRHAHTLESWTKVRLERPDMLVYFMNITR